MKNINRKLIIPVVVAITTYMISYWIPKFIVDINEVHYVYTSIDALIPLFSPAVIIYISSFIQWIIAIFILLKQDTLFGYKVSLAIILGSIIGFIVFLAFPTGVLRTNFEINNVFDWILSQIYFVDNPINACPSFHCFCSTITIIILKYSKNIDNKYRIINTIFSILVYASTLLTKQHYLIDVPTGILTAYLSYLISDKLIKNKKLNLCYCNIKLNKQIND